MSILNALCIGIAIVIILAVIDLSAKIESHYKDKEEDDNRHNKD